MSRIDYNEIMDLAGKITGVQDYDHDVEVENELADKYEIGIEQFEALINDLAELLTVSCSPLTGTPYVGFSEKYGWLLKKECQKQFIPSMITWLGDGTVLPENEKGYKKTITIDGKPTYDISIQHHKPNKTAIENRGSQPATSNQQPETKNS